MMSDIEWEGGKAAVALEEPDEEVDNLEEAAPDVAPVVEESDDLKSKRAFLEKVSAENWELLSEWDKPLKVNANGFIEEGVLWFSTSQKAPKVKRGTGGPKVTCLLCGGTSRKKAA